MSVFLFDIVNGSNGLPTINSKILYLPVLASISFTAVQYLVDNVYTTVLNSSKSLTGLCL